jgi:hypothetical protein
VNTQALTVDEGVKLVLDLLRQRGAI